MKEKEIWKKHSSGLLVSNLGQVFVPGSGRNPEHYTYGCLLNSYLKVTYNKKPRLVHDLVYETFHNIELNGLQVHHKNGNEKDNRLENLVALSVEDHQKIHGIERSKPVIQYDLNENFIREWDCIREIQRELGFFRCHIISCCKGKQKTAYGYIWKYKSSII